MWDTNTSINSQFSIHSVCLRSWNQTVWKVLFYSRKYIQLDAYKRWCVKFGMITFNLKLINNLMSFYLKTVGAMLTPWLIFETPNRQYWTLHRIILCKRRQIRLLHSNLYLERLKLIISVTWQPNLPNQIYHYQVHAVYCLPLYHGFLSYWPGHEIM